MSAPQDSVSTSPDLAEPRDEIINTAVKFLKNPHVSKSPLAKSQQFLRSKGLTDREIQIACEKSGAYTNYSDKLVPSLPISLPMHQMYHGPQSLFFRVRDTLHSAALFSGLIYAVYLFYKKFIKPWLFGEKKEKTIEESMSELSKSVTDSIEDLKGNLSEVRIQIEKIKEESTHVHLHDLKNEISSVKGLLLSRKQFPSVSGNIVPPSIPAWQLSSAQADVDVDGKAEELMEIGSGSGSSETEVVTKNSDSSLEIM